MKVQNMLTPIQENALVGREEVEGGRFDIVLHGTRGGVGLGKHVNIETLASMSGKTNRVTILSAYYVKGVLERIAEDCKGEVRIIVNGLGGQRLREQVAELKELQERLRKKNPTRCAKIKLAFADGIFHSKLYMFGTGSGAIVWIGSANATRAGLNGRNEEVLLRVEPAPQSVLAYVESVWDRSKPLRDCLEKVNSLVAFFRSGKLYYKPYATLPMTHNPFRKFLKSLPPAERSKISLFSSEFADPETGIGAFSLNRMFASFVYTKFGAPRPRFRPKAVETCYGYWVVGPCIPAVDKMLKRAADKKEIRLEAIFEWMSTKNRNIIAAYASYLGDVRERLKQVRVQGVNWDKPEVLKLFQDTSNFEKRLKFLLKELGPKRRKIHSKVFKYSEVPEIWEDEPTYKAFKQSFFDSLAHSSEGILDREGSAWLILDSLGKPGPSEAEDIEKELKSILENKAWYEDKFVPRQ